MNSREFFSDQVLHLCLHQIINFFGRDLGAGFKIEGVIINFWGHIVNICGHDYQLLGAQSEYLGA